MSNVLDHEWQSMIANSVCHSANMAQVTVQEVALRYAAPSVLYRPSLTRDGNQWCALYGANLMEGVCGFGDTPQAAMDAFDRAWAGQGGSNG